MAVSTSSRGFTIAHGVLKTLSIVCGLLMTLFSLMSVVGLATGNQWVRLIVATVVALALPLLLVDRLLPSDESKRTPGLPGDVFAVFYLLFALLFIGVGWHTTQGLMLREADRLAAADLGPVARVGYWLAGARPVETAPPPRVLPPVPRWTPTPDAGHAFAPAVKRRTISAMLTWRSSETTALASSDDYPARHRSGDDRSVPNGG